MLHTCVCLQERSKECISNFAGTEFNYNVKCLYIIINIIEQLKNKFVIDYQEDQRSLLKYTVFPYHVM